MPIDEGGGGGSGGGSGVETPQAWVSIPCPGFCPIKPCKFIYLKIPGGTSYTCGGGAPHTIAATTTYLQLRRGEKPGFVSGNCAGTGWSGTSVVTPDPMTYEGTSTLRVYVCCDTEFMSYPRLWVYFEDHIRLIGQPDPNASACIEGACMTTIRCECIESPDTGLPGFTHGTATLPNADLANYYGACACNIIVVGGGSEFEVKCYGNGACDCVGIPLSMSCKLECLSLGPVPPAGMVLVASGSMAYTEVDSIIFPSYTGPHWEGTMSSALGDGCSWNVAMVYDPNLNQMSGTFQGPNGTGCIDFCPPFNLPTGGSSSCDPFYMIVEFAGGSVVFTIGTPP